MSNSAPSVACRGELLTRETEIPRRLHREKKDTRVIQAKRWCLLTWVRHKRSCKVLRWMDGWPWHLLLHRESSHLLRSRDLSMRYELRCPVTRECEWVSEWVSGQVKGVDESLASAGQDYSSWLFKLHSYSRDDSTWWRDKICWEWSIRGMIHCGRRCK